MCNQAHSHSHGPFERARLGRFRQISRRTFLAGLGQSTFAVLSEMGPARNVIAIALGSTGLAACVAPQARPAAVPAATAASLAPTAAASQALNIRPVSLGFVNAYVLVRGDEVAIVDTGVVNSQSAIEAVIKAAGRSWGDVRHVILTHYHPDHAGSMDDVMTASAKAKAYAGAEDIPQITKKVALQAVGDGSEVFGLQIITTPGHTSGHISVYDPIGSALILGDAMNNTEGKLTGPNPQYSSDMVVGNKTVQKIAALKFERAFFGHGAPMDRRASAAVARLAETLK